MIVPRSVVATVQSVVDERAQIVVHAKALGSGYEAHLLVTQIEATRETFDALRPGKDVFKFTKVTADRGFHSKIAVAEVEKTDVDAYVADRMGLPAVMPWVFLRPR